MDLTRVALVAGALAMGGSTWAGTQQLVPRTAVSKATTFVSPTEDATGDLLVKFVDSALARADEDGYLASESADPLTEARTILAALGLSVRPAFNVHPAALQALEARAEAISGRVQPDLAGMMFVDGPDDALVRAAMLLNELESVEFVHFMTKRYLGGDPTLRSPDDPLPPRPAAPEIRAAAGGAGGDGVTGACCLDTGGCVPDQTPESCALLQGLYQGNGTTCDPNPCPQPGACCLDEETCEDGYLEEDCLAAGGVFVEGGLCEEIDCENIDCGGEITGDCFAPDGNGSAYCDDAACCNLICDRDPFCCDEEGGGIWDAFCAAQANYLCENIPEPPTAGCASPLNGSCFEVHFPRGCNNTACCESVCMVDPFCCDPGGFWDSGCVAAAWTECAEEPDPAAQTPDYEPIQGYLTPDGYGLAIPPDLAPFVPMTAGFPFVGYGGEGWFLEDPEDRYGGLRGLGEWLKDNNENNAITENLTRGRRAKVAVIEWGYHTTHEDLDVISEPGQTIIPLPEISQPDHGTACLSIINARDDGRGVTGIVPEAQAYFFPLTSLEEGPREMTAWANALTTMDVGDAISASYGPGPPLGNLNNDPSMAPIMRMASDLGITVCIAAGNSCYNLDGAPDQGDTGALVVGACSPGSPFYRLSFSNFCTDPDNARSNIVHVKAWGEIVTSAGYGVLYNGEPTPGRTYTPLFNGTSAAAPQIAGLVIGLQGIAKAFYGIPLMPEQLRGAMGAPGSPPNPPIRLFGGFPENQACGLDLDPDEGPNMIGVYPDVAGTFGSAASTILNQSGVGYDDAPLLDEVHVVRGRTVFGNFFSCKGSENSYLVVEGVHTNRSHVPNSGNTGVPEISLIRYLATGNITDVVAVGHADVPSLNTLTLQTEVKWPAVYTLMFMEMYDWTTGRWTFTDLIFDPETQAVLVEDRTNDYTFEAEASAPSRFIRSRDDRILGRLWTLGFTSLGGFGGSGNQEFYRMRYDLINFIVTEEFSETLP